MPDFRSTADFHSFVWIAANPFGEPTPYLLITPGSHDSAQVLGDVTEAVGLLPLNSQTDIPWVGTDSLCIALRGVFADLWRGDTSLITVPVSDDWTGAAIARRYVVLTVGLSPTEEDLSDHSIMDYIHRPDNVRSGLVRIRLRVTDQ